MNRFALLAAAAIALTITTTRETFAQAIPFDWRNEIPEANDDFTKCMNRDRANAERTIRSCGRVISERHSSEYTAAGYYSRGLMREMLQDTEGARADFVNAERYFSIAIGSRDRHTDAYRNRAAARYRLGRYAEAIEDYETALVVVSDARTAEGTRVRSGVADIRRNQVSGLHYRIGGVHFQARNWAGAREAFDRAAELAPNSASYQAARCEVRAAAGEDISVAEAACANALTLSDRSPESMFSLGFLQFSQENFAGALMSFTAASADEQNFLARYARGVVAVRLGQTEAGQAEIAAATQQIDASALAYYVGAGLHAAP